MTLLGIVVLPLQIIVATPGESCAVDEGRCKSGDTVLCTDRIDDALIWDCIDDQFHIEVCLDSSCHPCASYEVNEANGNLLCFDDMASSDDEFAGLYTSRQWHWATADRTDIAGYPEAR